MQTMLELIIWNTAYYYMENTYVLQLKILECTWKNALNFQQCSVVVDYKYKYFFAFKMYLRTSKVNIYLQVLNIEVQLVSTEHWLWPLFTFKTRTQLLQFVLHPIYTIVTVATIQN